VTPMAKFDPEIVLEFYAIAWPTEEGVRDMRSWVRGDVNLTRSGSLDTGNEDLDDATSGEER